MVPPAEPSLTAAPSKKILVVDDSKAMRRIVLRTLAEAGFSACGTLEASDGAEALRLARLERPDVVIADWNMPVMDGLSLLRALQAERLAPLCGLLTSDPLKARSEALAAGAQFVLPKPLTVDALRTALAVLRSEGQPSIPTAQDVSRMLSSLLGTAVGAEPGHKAVFAGTGLVLVGLYEKQHGLPAALVALDLDLASSLAASLESSAPETAAAIVKANRFSDAQLDSLRELLSVGASLFGPAGASPVQLASVHTQLRSLPTKAVVLAVRPASQGIFTVTVPGFGSGGMCVCIG